MSTDIEAADEPSPVPSAPSDARDLAGRALLSAASQGRVGGLLGVSRRTIARRIADLNVEAVLRDEDTLSLARACIAETAGCTEAERDAATAWLDAALREHLAVPGPPGEKSPPPSEPPRVAAPIVETSKPRRMQVRVKRPAARKAHGRVNGASTASASPALPARPSPWRGADRATTAHRPPGAVARVRDASGGVDAARDAGGRRRRARGHHRLGARDWRDRGAAGGWSRRALGDLTVGRIEKGSVTKRKAAKKR